MMVFLMVSTIGIFAVSAARYEQRAAGFDLHRASAVELSDLGVFLVAQQVTGSYASRAVARMRASTVGTAQADPCSANLGANQPCLIFDSHGMESLLGLASGTHIVALATAGANPVPGSLGLTALNGNFEVQLTELAEDSATFPGDETGKTCYMDVTITSTGVLWLDDGAGSGTAFDGIVNGTEKFSLTSAVSRARATIGPFRRVGLACGG
ncbi:MAG: hypothetical protein ACHREM_07615 [Polyangiales bacterium]